MSNLVLNPLLSRRRGATELYLIRHGDALPGVETVIPGGGYDSQPLSALGQQQAQALAEYLTSTAVKFDALYSSPLRRTQETAAPLAQAIGLPVQLEAELREVRLGIDLDGFLESNDPAATSKALKERLDAIMVQIGQAGRWSAIEGSESSESLRTRVVRIVTEISARHPAQRVALFSHGGVINAFAAEVFGLERDLFFPIHNTSITVVRCKGQEASIVSLNEIAHLRASQVETE